MSEADAYYLMDDLSKDVEADVLVLAGDIFAGGRIYHRVLDLLCKRYKHVVMVLGNHDNYHCDVRNYSQLKRSIVDSHENLYLLDNEPLTLDSQKFYGGSLWFKDDPKNQYFKQFMNDFKYIKNFEDWVYFQNQFFIDGLHKHVNEETIVISHHLPSPQCVDAKFKNSNLNRFFVCDLEEEILKYQPKLWLHGHTHCRVDAVIGKTRILASPRGYPNEKGVGFRPTVIDV
jgi:Icc-related predicted phosphoesterase